MVLSEGENFSVVVRILIKSIDSFFIHSIFPLYSPKRLTCTILDLFIQGRIGAKLMEEIGGKPITAKSLSVVKKETETWYHEQGYVYATVVSFD